MAWVKSIVEWAEGNNAFISVVFSWDLQEAYQRAIWYKTMGYNVHVGGPAIHGTNMFNGVAEVGGHIPDVVSRHNPNATFTTRGCPNKCAFCIVPKIEPQYKELDDFPIRPIVCDNNILASSDKHFDMACEKLSDLKDVDFNQGLDARLLTKDRAKKIANLNKKTVRLAFDSISYEKHLIKAIHILKDAGIKHITVYVLINFKEEPEDALYRLEKVRELGGVPFPMRYQPVDAKIQNSYLSPKWNESYLKDVIRYYSRLTWLGHIPFSEYRHISQKTSR
jgi:hypothetical protein